MTELDRAIETIMSMEKGKKAENPVVTDNSDLLTVLKKLRKKTDNGAGGGRLGEWFQGYDKAMVEMRVELNRLIKENS